MRKQRHECKRLLPATSFQLCFCKIDFQTASWVCKLACVDACSWTEHHHCLLPAHASHKPSVYASINRVQVDNEVSIRTRAICLQWRPYFGCMSRCGCSNRSNTQRFRSGNSGLNNLSMFEQTCGRIQPTVRAKAVMMCTLCQAMELYHGNCTVC